MAMTQREKAAVKEVISQALKGKLRSYTPKDKVHMPFHASLLGRDRVALFSFMQSLNTNFGLTIYEPVAEELARGNFKEVIRGKKSDGIISKGAQNVISDITNKLHLSDSNSSQKSETDQIRAVCQKGGPVKVKLRRADVYLVDKNNLHYLVEIKTARPNIDGFEKYKENMLRWTASVLYQNPKTNVQAMLAIPYNPDAPESYKHWTLRGMLESGTQIKVADEFWDFLAGKKVYDDLLNCFEEVGIEMRDKIDKYFADFRKK